MLQSRRHLSGLLFATAFLFVLFITSRHLGDLKPYYDGTFRSASGKTHEDEGFTLVLNETYTGQDATLTTAPALPTPSPESEDLNCGWMPDTSNILVIMKTGASESFGKIPTQLVTTLRCLNDSLIFSDMAQTIAGVEIHDSLAEMTPEAMEDNSDFDLYRQQQLCAVDQELCNKEASGSSSSAGWNLDKYKNIHIAETAYRMRPDYDWYITVDADTYVLWHNLVAWLRKLDPSRKRYLGSGTQIGGFLFGHGGSGYIISQAAMREFAGKHPGVAKKYDAKIKDVCCGDYMLGKALDETIHIGVENAWPTINGEKPFTLPFGPKHWCEPVVTMHHMNSEEISTFWEYERAFYLNQTRSQSQPPPFSAHELHPTTAQKPFTTPLLLKDIYHAFLAPRLQASRKDWDNLSDDVFYLPPSRHPPPKEKGDDGKESEKKYYEDTYHERARNPSDLKTDAERDAHRSFDDCAAMCEAVAECFQFRFRDGACSYQKAFLLGRPRKNEEKNGKKDAEMRWRSGWAMGKIEKWVKEHEVCKKGPVWPASIGR